MPSTPFIKPDRPSPEQSAAWRRLSFAEKLELVDGLRTSALRLKEASLRQRHPELSDDEIADRMRAYVLYGGS